MLGRVLGDCEMKTIYTIPAPNSIGAVIEVYGEPENAWYEWRILDGGRTVQDTGKEGHYGRQYGCAEIALHDALSASIQMVPGSVTRALSPMDGKISC